MVDESMLVYLSLQVSIASVACGIALVAAIFLFVTSAVNLVGVLTSCTQYYPKYDKYLKLGKVSAANIWW